MIDGKRQLAREPEVTLGAPIRPHQRDCRTARHDEKVVDGEPGRAIHDLDAIHDRGRRCTVPESTVAPVLDTA